MTDIPEDAQKELDDLSTYLEETVSDPDVIAEELDKRRQYLLSVQQISE